MLHNKNPGIPFVLKILNPLIKNGQQEMKWKIIATKCMWIRQNKISTVIKQSNYFHLNPFESNFLHSFSSRNINYACHGLPLVKLFNPKYNSGNISFSVRHYSKKTFILSERRNIFMIILIFSLSAGFAVYKVLNPHYIKNFSETVPTIIEEPKLLKFPESSQEIPDEIPYLIIGGGTSAFAAFRAIKSSDPTAKVLVINNELYYPYMRPPLSKELIFNKSNDEGDEFSFNQWNGKKRSVFFEPEEFYTSCEDLISTETGGVSVARGWNVKKLDHDNKIALLDDGKTIKYDKCLLATGSVPKQLDVLSKQNSNIMKKVLYYRSLNDFFQLENALKFDRNTKSVVVIGGGFSGTELACSLARKGVVVTQMFKEKTVLADILPEYLANALTEKVQKEGVNIIKNEEIEQAKLVDNKICMKTVNGHEVVADLAIVALGVTPNTDLAEEAGLEVDKALGGYISNSEFLVRRDLYAAGDCASFYDVKYGRRRVEHHDHAVLSGRLAGENMSGKGKVFKNQSMFWSDLASELGFEAVGVIDSSLPTVAVYGEDLETQTESSEKKMQDSTVPEFDRGVIFYLKDKVVVGVLLWNLYNKISIAKRVLKSDIAVEDLYEVAKHFKMNGT